MLTRNEVVELLRAESLDFTVLDAIKRIAPQFGRQSGGTIIQLAYAIVAARMYIHTPYASADTKR